LLRAIPLLIPFAALASESVAPGVPTGSYFQAALALSLIVALLAGTAWLARKVSGGKRFGQGGMKVIGGVALGPRERIVLLEIGDEWLVIGVVPGQIRTLHRMTKGNALPEDGLPAASAEIPFTQWLRSISDRRNNEK
jgi:flagellar protein FliO/FliZ